MKITSQIDEARQLHAESVERMEELDAKLQALPDDINEDELVFHRDSFARAKREAERRAETLERIVSIAEARQVIPLTDTEEQESRASRPRLQVNNEPTTYRKNGPHSFFQDLVLAKTGQDEAAVKRLSQHQHEMRIEQRAVTTASSSGAGFIPPIYLSDQWIQLPRAKRPFADKVPKVPLADDGMRMDFPRVATGAVVQVQAAETNTAGNQDLVTETYSANVRTIAGYVDLSRQQAERSRPGFDEVVFRDLMRAYDAQLDTQLISGSGANGQHAGLRNIASINTVTFSSGTADAFVKAIYNAAQQVASTVYEEANAILLHPRRAAWIAAFQGSVFPLLQQGGLYQAQGTQDQGFAGTIAGLPVILDANIATNLGAATNQDEAYVLDLDELMLAEGPLQTRVDEMTLSNSLQVRLVLYAYSAAALGRLPKAIAQISGAGLVPPTF